MVSQATRKANAPGRNRPTRGGESTDRPAGREMLCPKAAAVTGAAGGSALSGIRGKRRKALR